MVQKRNYNVEMAAQMAALPAGTPLVLHACCGPCSTAVLEKLAGHFVLTLLYYNPNIWPPAEYERRRDEQLFVLQKLPTAYPVQFVELPYESARFAAAATGLEGEKEGGARCEACFRLRLEEAARFAKETGIAWFTTTLSVSPHKNAPLLNAIGEELAEKYGLHYLASDFKKQDGYKRSLALSAELGLYRQDYCGCAYSFAARKTRGNN